MYCVNNPVMGYDPDGTFDWGTFWRGALLVATAVGAIVVSIATFGAATPLAMSIVAGVTLGAGILTGINGIATLGESFGDYNFVRDGIFNGLGWSDNAYNWYAGIVEGIAIVGTIACSVWQITSKIDGFTKHGLNQALTREGHGVSASAMQSATRSPLQVINQVSNSTIKYVGKNAVVVLNNAGKVVTTRATSSAGWRTMFAIWLGYGLLQGNKNY